jgi:hypothetical protein
MNINVGAAIAYEEQSEGVQGRIGSCDSRSTLLPPTPIVRGGGGMGPKFLVDMMAENGYRRRESNCGQPPFSIHVTIVKFLGRRLHENPAYNETPGKQIVSQVSS